MAKTKVSEYKMSEEIRKKLLNRLPFSRSTTIDYTPKAYLTKELDKDGNETNKYEIPDKYRPVFTLRPFSMQQRKDLEESKKENDKVYADNMDLAVRTNITNVKKLYDAGTLMPIEFKSDPDGGMDKDQYDSLPVIIRMQLFFYMGDISGMSYNERASLYA